MRTASAWCLSLLGLTIAAASGCGGGVSDAKKAEMLRDLRARVTAFKPPMPSAEEIEASRPQLHEPYVRIWSVQETVADSLGRIGPEAVPALIKTLSYPDPQVRLQATRALALVGTEAKAAVPELDRLLGDPNEEVRRGAARALGQIGPPAAPAIPSLLKLMEHPAHPAPAPASGPTGSH